MTNEPQKKCPAGEKLHNEYMLDGHCSHCHKSEPRKSWEDRLLALGEKYPTSVLTIGCHEFEELCEIVKSVEQAAYERGCKEERARMIESGNYDLKKYLLKATEQAITSERNRTVEEIEKVKEVYTGESAEFNRGMHLMKEDIINLLKSK